MAYREGCSEFRTAQTSPIRHILRRRERMSHETGIDILISSSSDKFELTASSFLGWGPEKSDTAWNGLVLENSYEAEKGCD